MSRYVTGGDTASFVCVFCNVVAGGAGQPSGPTMVLVDTDRKGVLDFNFDLGLILTTFLLMLLVSAGWARQLRGKFAAVVCFARTAGGHTHRQGATFAVPDSALFFLFLTSALFTSLGVRVDRVFRTISGSTHAWMVFTNVEVPAANVLGEIGEGLTQGLAQIGVVVLNFFLFVASQIFKFA